MTELDPLRQALTAALAAIEADPDPQRAYHRSAALIGELVSLARDARALRAGQAARWKQATGLTLKQLGAEAGVSMERMHKVMYPDGVGRGSAGQGVAA